MTKDTDRLDKSGRKKKWLGLLLLALSGFLTGFTVTGRLPGVVAFFSLIPAMGWLLSYQDKPAKLGKAYAAGLFFFFFYHLAGFHWFLALWPLSFLEGFTPGAAAVVVAVAWLGLSFFQAVGGGLVFLLAALVARARLFAGKRRLVFLALPGMLWALNEWSLSWGWWGCPWNRLALSQLDNLPFLQSASLLGVTFVSFLLVSVNCLFAQAIKSIRQSGSRAVGSRTDSRRQSGRYALAALGLLAAVMLSGFAVLMLSPVPGEGTGSKVALVQANQSTREKWDGDRRAETLQLYRTYTKEAAARGASLVVWPETAFPYYFLDDTGWRNIFSGIAEECGVTLVFGTVDHPQEGGAYNILCAIDKEGVWSDTVYVKRHLVPFGEFVPMASLFETIVPPLADLIRAGGDFSPGEESHPFVLDGLGRFAPMICYDVIYPDAGLSPVREGADYLLAASNNSWFTGETVMSMQKGQAMLRAIETGKPLMHDSNNGLTCLVDAQGRTLAELAPNEEGVLLFDLPPAGGTTVYDCVGELFPWLCLAVVAAGCVDLLLQVIANKRKGRKEQDA